MNKTCWWQAPISIMDNREFKTSCRDNKGLLRGRVPNNFSFQDFKYCPWCGGEIKWVEEQQGENTDGSNI